LCVFHRSNKKNVVVNWLGASVAPLKRAKASTTFGSVIDIFSVSCLRLLDLCSKFLFYFVTF
jgi:hypothetical protein